MADLQYLEPSYGAALQTVVCAAASLSSSVTF